MICRQHMCHMSGNLLWLKVSVVCIRYSVPMPAGMEPGPDATKDGGKPRLHLLKVWHPQCPSNCMWHVPPSAQYSSWCRDTMSV